ncbi:hypothetical protein [uncultured Methylobacterium sp.]|jgi:hypothetical protein|uniref:hypothetical protein n=1 Tax=uncultured Methylobacterium sp. TaxID=157278 RepID=UPI0026223B44|nr:hypothetical protein [uncultured Methylobacterium sp.]
MRTQEFIELLDKMMAYVENAGAGGGGLSACMSKPSSDLINLYGPMTDKVFKEKSRRKAEELYNKYGRNQVNNDYWRCVNDLATKVGAIGLSTTNGSIGGLSNAIQAQQKSFAAMEKVLTRAAKVTPGTLEGCVLAAGDVLFIGALSALPLVGPLAAPLAQTTIQGLMVLATQAGIASVSSGTRSGDTTAGAATLCSMGIKALKRMADDSIIAQGENSQHSFLKIINNAQLTQNQAAAMSVNSLNRAEIKNYPTFKSVLAKQQMLSDREATLEKFGKNVRDLYDDFFELLEEVLNSGIANSFKSEIRQLNLGGAALNDNTKIAMVILGYFAAKDWGGEYKPARQAFKDADKEFDRVYDGDVRGPELDRVGFERYQAQQKFTAIAERLGRSSDVNAPKTATLSSLNPTSSNIGRSGGVALDVARNMLSKKSIVGFDPMQIGEGSARDHEIMKNSLPRAKKYVKALHSALAADIETIVTKTYYGASLTADDYEQIWKLYVGSQLVVSHSIRDSRIKTQSSGIRKFFSSATSVTQATSIPNDYVKLIEEAGFITRYKGSIVGTVSREQKVELAKNNTIRWSFSPSDTERAMLITFCTIVVFTLDIGKISLGFVDWRKTRDELKNICNSISVAAYNDRFK